jgi:DNA (cytosine-5)-methyltransferase 1
MGRSGGQSNDDVDARRVIMEPHAIYCNESRCDNIPPAGVSPPLKVGSSGCGNPPAIAFNTTQITSKANYSKPKPGDPCHPLASGAHAPAVAFDTYNHTVSDVSQTLQRGTSSDQIGAALSFQTRIGRNGRGQPESLCPALSGASAGATSDMRPCVATRVAVRRLTPKECERLQGFPDGYTEVTYRGKRAADGPRYKALGNSMAVPVMRWIGERIAMVEEATDGR